MTYKYGDRITVRENNTFGFKGAATVVSVEEGWGEVCINYLPDSIKWYAMPPEGTPWEIGQFCVLPEFVTPLDNGD